MIVLSKRIQPMIKSVLAALWAFLTPRGRYFRRTRWQPLSPAGAFQVNGADYVPDTSALPPMAEADSGSAGPALPTASVARDTPAAPDASRQAGPCPVLAFEPALQPVPTMAEPAEQTGQSPLAVDDNMLDYPGQEPKAGASQALAPAPPGALDAMAMRLEFAHFYFRHDKPAAAAELLQYVQQHGDAEQMARAERLRAEFTAG